MAAGEGCFCRGYGRTGNDAFRVCLMRYEFDSIIPVITGAGPFWVIALFLCISVTYHVGGLLFYIECKKLFRPAGAACIAGRVHRNNKKTGTHGDFSAIALASAHAQDFGRVRALYRRGGRHGRRVRDTAPVNPLVRAAAGSVPAASAFSA